MKSSLASRASWLMVAWVIGMSLAFAQSSGGKPESSAAQAALVTDSGAPDDSIWVKGRIADGSSGRTRSGIGGRTEVALGDYVILKLNEPLRGLLDKERVGYKLGLYINDLYFKDIAPVAVPGRGDTAMFRLALTDNNREQWSVLFSRKGFRLGRAQASCDRDPNDGITLAVGFPDGVLTSPLSSACLEYFPDRWTATGLILLAVAIAIGTLWLSLKSSMIRDGGIPPPGKLAPYSLARFQMALWFVTIVFGVLFVFAVTGDISPIPDGTLILMGIGAGTAVGAAAIDLAAQPWSKADYLSAQALQPSLDDTMTKLKKQIADVSDAAANDPALEDLKSKLTAAIKVATANATRIKAFEAAPASQSFIRDILSDGGGVAFHRLQVFAWTMIFWTFFVGAIFHKITLIDFAASQLALMGISGATYLGFKLQLPKQSEAA